MSVFQLPSGELVPKESAEVPYLEPYIEPSANSAVIVCPGGGYTVRAAHEGEPIARWLNSIGVSAFVLQYRVAPNRHPAPLSDAQRAMRLVRHRAKEWGIRTDRIGILGFSAGGHLAATLSTHWDRGDASADDPIERESCRPDATILCYAVVSMSAPYMHSGSRQNLLGPEPSPDLCRDLSIELQVNAETPPAFLWHTADDASVPVDHAVDYSMALRRHGVPFALHVFPHGRHGLGLAPEAPDVAKWTDLCADWLHGLGFR